jgi:hypothetical protein
MSVCRGCRYAIAAGGLALLAAVLWLPVDSGRAAPRSTALGPDLGVLPGDCALFVTVRPADFTKDPLAQLISEGTGIRRGMERDFGVSLADLERITVAVVAGGNVEIIRTSKRFDRKKLLSDLSKRTPRFGPFEKKKGFRDKKEVKDKKDFKDKEDPEEKAEAKEKKFGARTLYYFGKPTPWTPGLCFVGDNVVVRGTVHSLEALLSSKTKRSTELTDMLGAAGEHSLVAGFQGKPLRARLRREFRNSRRGYSYSEPPRKKVRKEKEEKEEKDTELVLPPNEALFLAPYKPLLMMQTALITVDLKKGYTATGRISFPSKEATDEGELSAKVTLYVLRELAVGLTKHESDMRVLAPLSEPALQALKAARIKRTGKTLETTLRLPAIPASTVQKIRRELARVEVSNNLKQLALAFHNHASAVDGSFPAQANYDKDGKPLLSWRVHILPYIEQQPLYNEFKLNGRNRVPALQMAIANRGPSTKARCG